MSLPSIDLALIRWSVVHRQWHELANDMPYLPAFLAGWGMRCMDAEEPPKEKLGKFPDSFRVGWREAHEQLAILAQQTQNPKPTGYTCALCGADRPGYWYWYEVTTDDLKNHSPCCAMCARRHKSQGPFKLPVSPNPEKP